MRVCLFPFWKMKRDTIILFMGVFSIQRPGRILFGKKCLTTSVCCGERFNYTELEARRQSTSQLSRVNYKLALELVCSSVHMYVCTRTCTYLYLSRELLIRPLRRIISQQWLSRLFTMAYHRYCTLLSADRTVNN